MKLHKIKNKTKNIIIIIINIITPNFCKRTINKEKLYNVFHLHFTYARRHGDKLDKEHWYEKELKSRNMSGR
jgi:hypothetical protein